MLARPADYFVLCKPRVVALMLLTSVVGILLASVDRFPWFELLFANLGIALCAFAAASVNHVVDRHMDARMIRTNKRPIVTGKVPSLHALVMACVLAVAGFAVLYQLVNPLTAWLTLASLFGYAVIYTALLKRATTQNIVIGGLAGAMPPMLGWTSVTNTLDAQGWLLVAIIFLWTPPHFWALSLARVSDYRKTAFPMLNVVYGQEITTLHSFLYSLLLFTACILPFAIAMSGVWYLIGSLVLNVHFVFACWRLHRDYSDARAMRLFWHSIYYLMGMFVVLLSDHALGIAGINWYIG